MKNKHSRTKKTQNRQKISLPLTELPNVVRLIDKGVEAAENLLQELAKHRQVIDDVPVALLKEEHSRQLEILSSYADQVERWKKQPHSMDEHFELMRLDAQCEQLKTLLTEILAKTNQPDDPTTDKIMDMDDAELGLKFLLGEISQ